jgi:outer membrane protein insertion porin family
MLKQLGIVCVVLLAAVTAFAEDFTVSDIQISGNNRIAESAIISSIAIRSGDNVNIELIDEAIHAIYRTGNFTDVTAEVQQDGDISTLIFSVRELPLIRTIEFPGVKESKLDKLKERVKVRTPSIYNKAKIKESITEIKNYYINDGYHAVKVETELQTDVNNEATLVFHVTPGDKILIGEVIFVGTSIFTKKELMKNMETKEKWFLSWLTGRGAYLKDAMALDIERIKMAYQDVGYYDAVVKPAEVTLVDDKYLQIVIEVDEGELYHLRNLQISGDKLRDEAELRDLVALKPGDVFGRSKVRESVLALTDLYANNGYAYVNVTPLTKKHKDELLFDLELNIEQGQLVYIEKINIHGNTKTREKVIRREIPLVEGEKYDASKVKAANRKIRNLGFFEEVNVTNKQGSSADKTVLDVGVSEQATGTFSVGVGYSTSDSVVFSGSISQNNFMGYGINLSLSGSLGGSSTTYSLSVTEPHLLDTDWTLGGEIYKSESEYDDYDDDRTGFALKSGHPVSENSKLYLTYRLEEKEISDIDDDVTSPTILDAEGTSLMSSITTEWVRKTIDNYQDPSSGGVTKLSLELAGFGGTEDFLKGIAEHRHYFPLFGGTVFSVHGSIGYIVETWGDEDIPLSEKFFLGGLSSIRGFESREVGPMEDGEYIGGEKMAYANFEYIFPLAKDMGIKGLFFFDIGNAWSEDEAYFSDMRYSVGTGIRWLSPIGPLRFEWGYNLDPTDDEDDSVFEFSIGTAL